MLFVSDLHIATKGRAAYHLKSDAAHNQERKNQAQCFADYSALRESLHGHRNLGFSQNQSTLYRNTNEGMKDDNEKEEKEQNLH